MPYVPATPDPFSAEDDKHANHAQQATQPQTLDDLVRIHLAKQTTQPQSRLDLPRLSLPYKPPIALDDPGIENGEIWAKPASQEPESHTEADMSGSKHAISRWQRLLAVGLLLSLCVALYFIWRPDTTTSETPAAPMTQSMSTSTASDEQEAASTGATLQAYIVGAVKHPGVYVLATGSRIHHLLEAAGGPLPNANLVALNLAAPLTDGEEVYVAKVGEPQPSNIGGTSAEKGTPTATTTDNTQRVNINTASEDEMRQVLHVSSTTAKNTINYRTQHGPYTSVEQLLQVISEAIYKRIKDMVTV